MRIIDYSGPKKSCNTPPSNQNFTRKEPLTEKGGAGLFIAFISGFICLCIGFGSGWMLSQRSAKKAFKAAMEQQSLENTPQQPKASALPLPQPVAAPAVPPVPSTAQQPASTVSTSQTAPAVTQPPADPPLSFYNTLPRGQKSNVMGSGINNKEDKPAKQPLQAAMPTNIVKPVAVQNDENPQKSAAPPQAAKAAARPDASSGLTVQVASYSLKSEAEAQRAKLASKGYNVNISESHQGDKGIWYRVRVGKKLDPEAAKELAGKLGKGAVAIPDKD